ncbi:MAG TPA: hypothetical protein DCE41_19050, partial [Cytophagales bacterium]|nr:hypothetical protein [Cytophagales bacterium]
MKLVLKSELEVANTLVLNEVALEEGKGSFLVAGSAGNNKTVLVRYYQPTTFTQHSKVIFVVPGAGRNALDYREAWMQAAEQYGVLLLVPEYSEQQYPEFWSYNLAGMIYDVDIQKQTFKINANASEWLFEDFDKIFQQVRTELGLETPTYDMFGHSAGGQILHRMAIFNPENLADRILASNSGWYTLPTNSEAFPYGTKGLAAVPDPLDFSQKLILFLGEEDNASETRGHLRRSPEVDRQGLH